MRGCDGKVHGASLLVVRDGQPLPRRGYGMAHLEAGVAAAPSSN